MKFWKIFLASLLAFVAGFVILFVYLIGSGVNAMMSMGPAKASTAAETVLVIDLAEGIVDKPAVSPMSGFDPATMTFSQPISLMQALAAIEGAASDDNIKGICIKQDGAGMISSTNIEELRSALLRFKSSGKFIIAYDDMYTQSEYWLASVADRILMQPEGSFEWRGLSYNLVFFKGLLDKIGAEVEIFRPTVCKYKSAVEPYFLTKMSDANRQQMQAIADVMWQVVVDDVAASRKLDSETLKTIARELSIALPEDALKYGLVDRLAYEDELIEEIKELGVKPTESGLVNMSSLGEYVTNMGYTLLGGAAMSDNRVAVLYAEGEIIDGSEPIEGQIVGSALASDIRTLRLDDKVKAVVMRVNSPGGSALASDIVWREMKLLQQTKPVVISMGDAAASGGYYISCPADYIVANRLTITGSIGVFGMIPNIGNTLKQRLGITFDEAATSPSASGMSLVKPLTAAQREALIKGVDRVYATFTENVAEGRNLSIEEVYAVAEGRVWSGKEAVDNGLVDINGGLSEAIAMAADMADLSNDFSLMEYSAPLTPFEEWLNSMGMLFAANYGIDFDIYGEDLISIFNECRYILTDTGIQAKMPYIMTSTL